MDSTASPSVRSRIALGGSGSQKNSRMSVVRASHAFLGRQKGPEVHIAVLDNDGNDVTPQSLFGPSRVQGKLVSIGGTMTTEGSLMASMTKENVADVLNNLETVTSGSWGGSAFGKSGLSGSSRASGLSDDDDEGGASVASNESFDEREEAAFAGRHAGSQRRSLREPGDIDPNRLFHVKLSETDTVTLLDFPSLSVSTENNDEYMSVKTGNARYKDLKAGKQNNDNFVGRGIQTFNEPSKNKEVQAFVNKQCNAECMTNIWSIHDAYNPSESGRGFDSAEKGTEREVNLGDEIVRATVSTSTALVAESSDVISVNAMGSKSAFRESLTDTVFSSVFGVSPSENVAISSVEGGSTGTVEKELSLLNHTNLMATLQLMEKAIVGNIYEKRLIAYRDVEDAEALEEKRQQLIMQQERIISDDNATSSNEFLPAAFPENGVPLDKNDVDGLGAQALQLLWSYRCELTRGRAVCYTALNAVNEDILAVAYGANKNKPGEDGLILIWSVKNPEWPERVYVTSSSVTAIDFSKLNPSLLAAGFQDGHVIIYDVRPKNESCVLDTGDSSEKHRDPVWELKWIANEVFAEDHSGGEFLVSVSTDGRVTQWRIRKGIESADLMSLKSMNKSLTNSKNSSFISRQSGGLCFDFHPGDSNIYLVGTEDGFIHRCSQSYNEQYLDSYTGHTGPVYKTKWSPFLNGVFISCSSDWTVRLWNQDEEKDIFKFQNGKDAIMDVSWSPHTSTIFGCVATDGRLEIWDLKHSVLDPIIVQTVLDRQLTSIAFSGEAPIIITGDDNGVINVYKLFRITGHVFEGNTAGRKSKNREEFELQANSLQAVLDSRISGMAS